MSEVVREMLAFQFGVFVGFCAGMAGMAFMWWMSGRRGR
jgi:H+/Cl- antiporter ClcA